MADPDRLLTLLWRHDLPTHRRRGPVPGHSVDELVHAAVALADHDGITSVTMRALAREVGIAPMSVYTHVPDREALLALMVDHVLGELPTASWGRLGWRRRVRQVADAHLALLAAHPWLTDADALNRPSLGPGGVGAYEWELGAFTPLGLDDLSTDRARALVLAFVRENARSGRQARAAAAAQSDQDWWDAHGPVLAQVATAGRYPLATRIGSAAGQVQGSAYDGDGAYEFGVERIIDGLAAMLR
ncbi:helix-turn-helix transcriptional regulator [Ruania alkalisoli]|uniref:Helix-turn-helix transcriptional regulator n=1 Tax=Ruania alkalisoli TaxID=2779775 RepID=A0A7M1SXQ7_9MICO|nr:TetR/AcrR family transcriptional regulator [Ruania alkalisoli]QOR71754.1 helix-turn-helix transcriptional regulator [Ruania alkalisoli]